MALRGDEAQLGEQEILKDSMSPQASGAVRTMEVPVARRCQSL
jgi:hypothetical protein